MRAADLLRRIEAHAADRPSAIALEDGRGAALRWADLPGAVETAARSLRDLGAGTVGILAENGIPQAVLDLAALSTGVLLVPMPPFFSDAQVRAVTRDAEIEILLADDPSRVAEVFHGRAPVTGGFGRLTAFRVGPAGRRRTAAARVTYTSGSTGDPRGVVLDDVAMLAVAESLRAATSMTPDDRHLGLLPHGVLLENIGGLYRCMLAGAACILPPLHDLGLSGSTGVDGDRLAEGLARFGASTGILVPGILAALVDALERRGAAPSRARLYGVGGARVPVALLRRARAAGFPVFEGYGLSEASSVVTLNAPGADRPGSAGRPLPHVEVRIAADGEVLVRGALFRGYLGGDGAPEEGEFLPTGDLGRLDEDGFLHLMGRRRNLFITSFGRNVSPEWIEAALTDGTRIDRAVVFGEGRPAPVALLTASSGRAAAEADLRRVLPTLPDYARPAAWIHVDTPLTVASGHLTPNGRPRRDAVWATWREALEAAADRAGCVVPCP